MVFVYLLLTLNIALENLLGKMTCFSRISFLIVLVACCLLVSGSLAYGGDSCHQATSTPMEPVFRMNLAPRAELPSEGQSMHSDNDEWEDEEFEFE